MSESVETCLRNSTVHTYIWERDDGDGTYTGKLDREKVDKDEGYEVAYFIEQLLKNNQWKISCENVKLIEKKLHLKELSSIVDRTDLENKIVAFFTKKK